MTCEGASRLVALELAGPAGPLEGLLQECEGRPGSFAALVCHPHPLFGGTMHNKVVHRVAATLFDRGAIVLRFNFRGVGASAGRHDRGRGELDDARAALRALRARVAGVPVVVGGFSFGAAVAARLAASEPDLAAVVLVAPPVTEGGVEAMRASALPKLVIQGTADDVCPLATLEPEFAAWAEPKKLTRVDGANHYFDGQLVALGEAVLEGLAALPAGLPS
ncbi:MAG TPA: alpha/beta fold hydrolase [Terriglobales bacterium]|nr:alpha/beta fold hydrolase [Terriglobales bacterium]